MQETIFYSLLVAIILSVILCVVNLRFAPKIRKRYYSPWITFILVLTLPFFLTGLLSPQLGWLFTGMIVGMVIFGIVTVFPIKIEK